MHQYQSCVDAAVVKYAAAVAYAAVVTYSAAVTTQQQQQ